MEAEWSHFFDIQNLKGGKQRLSIGANDTQRQDLSRRFGILSIESLTADITIQNNKGNASVKTTGKFQASITQECGITGAPVTTDLSGDIEGWFTDPDRIIPITKARRDKAIKEGQELQILPEHEDPEPFIDGKIDLGELVAQHMSLTIPPYPKADDADFEGDHLTAGDQDPAFDNPFAKLKDWKDKL